MKIALYTPLPRFAGDLCDVLRLFWPVETFAVQATAPVVPGDVGTYGGVVTDENARVLRDDGSVIQGLYATGISTASVMGRIYPGAGSSVGPSFVFGYIAAKHAAHVVKPVHGGGELAKMQFIGSIHGYLSSFSLGMSRKSNVAK